LDAGDPRGADALLDPGPEDRVTLISSREPGFREAYDRWYPALRAAGCDPRPMVDDDLCWILTVPRRSLERARAAIGAGVAWPPSPLGPRPEDFVQVASSASPRFEGFRDRVFPLLARHGIVCRVTRRPGELVYEVRRQDLPRLVRLIAAP
jgi:hypothetical protein